MAASAKMEKDMSTPIIVMSFNRPSYMERFCDSLKAQQRPVEQSNLYLMQDWGRSERTGCVYASEADLKQSIAVFRKHFPMAHIIQAQSNLGIALNFERAENFAFNDLKSEVAYFFEDDLVLGPQYLAMLDRIYEIGRDFQQLGYFACYGDSRIQTDEGPIGFIPLEHHWGFGLTRNCWQAMSPWIEPFYNIYRHCDYKWRPHLSILKTFFSKDVAWNGTSQDVIKTAACASLGYSRINTNRSFAKYIGEVGQSFTPELYQSLGFGDHIISEENVSSLGILSQNILQDIASLKLGEMRRFRNLELEDHVNELSLKMSDPERLASRDEIDRLWWSIMDRTPEEEYYRANVGINTIRYIRSNLLSSEEAKAKSFLC